MRAWQFSFKLILLGFLVSNSACDGHKEEQKLPEVPPIPVQTSDRVFFGNNIEGLARGSQKTNVLFILADDLGYGDIRSYGTEDMITPNLDRMCTEGIALKNFYAASPVCSPSRASFHTGRFPVRFGHDRHFYDNEKDFLPDSIATIAERFKENGYFTALIGKWHLGGVQSTDMLLRLKGDSTTPGPFEAGYHHYFSQIEEKETRWMLHHLKKIYFEGWRYTARNDSLARLDPVHHSTLKTKEAMDLMGACQREDIPFFVNLCYELPHKPYEAVLGKEYDQYGELGYAGEQLDARSMISQLDRSVGELMSFLKESGLYENTLVVFTSDNGAASGGNTGPFDGGKSSLVEGGVRVPLIFYGPLDNIDPRFREFSEGRNRFHFVDLFPSLVDILRLESGIDPDLDGLNILSDNVPKREFPFILKAQSFLGPHPWSKTYGNRALISNEHKLIMKDKNPKALFDLESDPFEEKNLVESNRQRIKEMTKVLEEYFEDNDNEKG